MEDLNNIFSPEEKEELATFKEICNSMSVEGQPVICFDVLIDILEGKLSIKGLPTKQLLDTYIQMKKFSHACTDLIWFDSENLEKIIPKFKLLVKNELNQRKRNIT